MNVYSFVISAKPNEKFGTPYSGFEASLVANAGPRGKFPNSLICGPERYFFERLTVSDFEQKSGLSKDYYCSVQCVKVTNNASVPVKLAARILLESTLNLQLNLNSKEETVTVIVSTRKSLLDTDSKLFKLGACATVKNCSLFTFHFSQSEQG
jgi:hypothetical protein